MYTFLLICVYLFKALIVLKHHRFQDRKLQPISLHSASWNYQETLTSWKSKRHHVKQWATFILSCGDWHRHYFNILCSPERRKRWMLLLEWSRRLAVMIWESWHTCHRYIVYKDQDEGPNIYKCAFLYSCIAKSITVYIHLAYCFVVDILIFVSL